VGKLRLNHNTVILFMYQKLHLWGREEVYARFWWGNQRRERPLGRPCHRWVGNIMMDLQEAKWGRWTGLIWLRIGTGGRHL
jgi:hypothetical protein